MSEQRVSSQTGRLRLLGRFRQMDEAAHRKFIRFVWSGLAIMVLGLILIAYGSSLGTGAYSAEGLLVGFGGIAVIVGFIRVLIGFISPSSPSELPQITPMPVQSQQEELHAELFEDPNSV